jgi:chromosome segregation ATPase
MKSHEFIKESGPEVSDYQHMMNFVNNNRTPGVPPDQQVAVAMFRELKKQQQQNQQLARELDAAEQRIDVATQGGELAKQQLGKHQGELEKERGNMQKQREKMGQIDQQHSEREKASAEQMQNLTAQLEQIKRKPGVDPKATKALEKQIEELKQNGVDAEKYQALEQSIANMQNMQQVDDQTMKTLINQVRDAQAKAAEISVARDELGKQIDTATGDAEEQLAQLKQQLSQLNGLTTALQSAVTDVLPAKIEQVSSKVQELDGESEMVHDELLKHDTLLNKLTGGVPGADPEGGQSTPQTSPKMPPQAPPAAPAPQQQQRRVMAANPGQIAPRMVQSRQWREPEPTFEDSKLMKSIKWATGK